MHPGHLHCQYTGELDLAVGFKKMLEMIAVTLMPVLCQGMYKHSLVLQ